MKKFIRTLSIISALSLISTVVFAETAGREVTVYPGSICKPVWGDSTKVQYNNGNVVALAPVAIECPLVREISDSSDVWVTVMGNKGSTGTLYCSFRDTASGGNTTRYNTTTSATNSGSFFIYKGIKNTHFWGSYSLYCYLPSRGARIKQIAIEEKYL